MNETNSIAAIVINEIVSKDDDKKIVKLTNDCQLQLARKFAIWRNEKVDLYEKFRVNQIFDVKKLSVDREYRGRGLAKMLVEESEKRAREFGLKLMKADASSYYSQKLLDGFGWFTVIEFPYKDYVDENGVSLIRTEAPHLNYQLKCKILD